MAIDNFSLTLKPFIIKTVFILLISICCYCNISRAQSYLQLNSFTTNEGLASNHVYDIAEDNKGFLWTATDNGISRFDGKYFKNFSVKDGLPSNDVLQVAIENDGTVWVNCYKQPPAYFDEANNKFIPITNNDTINEISKTLLFVTKMPNGGLRFYNRIGSGIFLQKKLVACAFSFKKISTALILIEDNEELYLSGYTASENDKIYFRKFFILKHDKIIDSNWITLDKWQGLAPTVNNNQLYFFLNDNIIHKVSNLQTNPVHYTIDSTIVPEAIQGYKFSDKHLCIIGKKGHLFIFDKKSLALQYTMQLKQATNSAYVDRQNNLWIATLDKGLLYFNNNGINCLSIPPTLLNKNFLSIDASDKGQLFAGNYYGEVLQANGSYFKKHDISNNYKANWLRKTICLGQKVITIQDEGVNIDFNKSITIYNKSFGFNQPTSVKTAISLNDSIIILGTIDGLTQLNINTLASKALKSVPDRVLSLAEASDEIIYYIGPNGLYKYDYRADSSFYIPIKNQLPGEKPDMVAIAPDGKLWISTTAGSLLVLQNEKILAVIPNNTGLPENITCMLPLKNEIWAGSKSGLSIIEYSNANKPFNYTIWNVSKVDGLPSNTVNDLTYYNDTVYAATENGIASIPVNYKHSEFEVGPQLISVKINQKSTAIALNYQLKSNQNNISLEFAGVELTGHFKTLMYAIDDETNFTNLTGNTLNLQLSSGKHIVYVKAMDINNKESKTVLKIHFYVNTPFYKTTWFWLLVTATVLALFFWLYNRRKINKQQTAFRQQLALEQQRNKITADLHDDIGSSLSSLQVNSAVANQLIDKDTKQAKQVLDKIENQSKDLADKIGDIIWSMKPGKDEFMTMSSRIKNFANDMLGSTDMDYEVKIDAAADIDIKDITVRKNIVLITKEAINNAVKYSKANYIFIQLKKDLSAGAEKGQFVLNIKDNGIGFITNGTNGNGIANMKKRAAEINATFSIGNAPGKGTSVLVLIPVP